MSKPKYAKHTAIDVATTRHEIEAIICRWGGQRFRFMADPAHRRDIFIFEIFDPGHSWLPISYAIKRYGRNNLDLTAQELRSRYRAVRDGIKMKLVQIDEDIETPAQAFHAHIVVDRETGETMFDRTRALLSIGGPNSEHR
jgi:hypothetical protein